MTQKNRVGIAIDVSGSMESIRQDAINLINNIIGELKTRFSPDTEATLVYFGLNGYPNVAVRYQNVPLRNIQPLRLSDYKPEGMTPLYDGIATAIEAMECHDPEMSYALWVASDGRNNDSRRHNESSIRRLIADKQGTDRWTVAVMIHSDHIEDFRRLNAVPSGNILSWGDIRQAEVAAVASVSTYATVRSTGARSAKAVFTSDLSGVTKRDLSKQRNITSEVKVKQVKKTLRIDHLVNEWLNGGFVPGTCFYMVQKTERIQADKQQFIIAEKGKKEFYVVDRDFLGMPQGEVKLVPGNHANYDIWALSSSNNRNVLAGSRIIYWPNVAKVAAHIHNVPGVTP